MTVLSQQQQQFAGFIRSGEGVQDGVPPARMAVYQSLFFNNIKGFADTTFPVCAAVLGESEWLRLVRAFFHQHRSTTPYFLQISEEFLHWLPATHWAAEYPWLTELAHYEWLELAVDTSADPSSYGDGDALTEIPVLAAGACGQLYQYPVHRIRADQSLPAVELTALIVFRDAQDAVRFIHCNTTTLSLLLLLQAAPRTGNEAIEQLLTELNLSQSETARQGARAIIHDWQKSGLIVGVRRNNDE